MITTSLFVIANVKKLRTWVVLEFYCLFFRTSWGVGVLNSTIFNSFHNRAVFGTILEGLRNFGGAGVWTPQIAPPRYATASGDTSQFTVRTESHTSSRLTSDSRSSIGLQLTRCWRLGKQEIWGRYGFHGFKLEYVCNSECNTLRRVRANILIYSIGDDNSVLGFLQAVNLENRILHTNIYRLVVRALLQYRTQTAIWEMSEIWAAAIRVCSHVVADFAVYIFIIIIIIIIII